MTSSRSPLYVLGLAAASALLCSLSGCGVSVDPVRSGRLCIPSNNGCDARATVTRPEPGVNRLDIVLTRRGEGRPDVTLRVVDATASIPNGDASTRPDLGPDVRVGRSPSPSPPDAGFGLASDAPVTVHRYRPGEAEIVDRLVPVELPRSEALELRLSCRSSPDSPCRVQLDYVFSTERPECESDGDCRSDFLCNEKLGRCVECESDDDCASNQSCNPNNGQCIPREGGGCRIAPVSPRGLPSTLVWLALGLGVWVLLRRRRGRTWRTAGLAWLASLACVGSPTPSVADSPDSSLSLDTGSRWLLGDMGEHTQRGVGMTLRQGLRGTYVGGEAWLGTNYFLTDQPPPPLTHELQIFGFGLGPRVYVPLGDVELMAGGGYQRVGLAPNSLIRQTPSAEGATSNFHAFGGMLGAFYRWRILRAGAHVSMYGMLDLPASMLSFDISIGLSTR